jgi:hypothetical protein
MSAKPARRYAISGSPSNTKRQDSEHQTNLLKDQIIESNDKIQIKNFQTVRARRQKAVVTTRQTTPGAPVLLYQRTAPNLHSDLAEVNRCGQSAPRCPAAPQINSQAPLKQSEPRHKGTTSRQPSRSLSPLMNEGPPETGGGRRKKAAPPKGRQNQPDFVLCKVNNVAGNEMFQVQLSIKKRVGEVLRLAEAAAGEPRGRPASGKLGSDSAEVSARTLLKDACGYRFLGAAVMQQESIRTQRKKKSDADDAYGMQAAQVLNVGCWLKDTRTSPLCAGHGCCSPCYCVADANYPGVCG